MNARGLRHLAAPQSDPESLEATCESIRHSEERYRLIFETSVDCIAINRVSDGIYIDANQAFLDAVGFAREELLGRTSLELGIWADPDDRKAMVEELRRDNACHDLEACFRRKSGEVFWGRMSAALMEFGGAPCILSITRDISEAKIRRRPPGIFHPRPAVERSALSHRLRNLLRRHLHRRSWR
jgi:PAS domain S-box-containing protein